MRPLPLRLVVTVLISVTVALPGCDGGGGGGGGSTDSGSGSDDGGGDGDECEDRGSSRLGGVCYGDCDCAKGFTCYSDEYGEQCCAEELADLENGVFGVDCDGVQ